MGFVSGLLKVAAGAVAGVAAVIFAPVHVVEVIVFRQLGVVGTTIIPFISTPEGVAAVAYEINSKDK